MRCSACGTTALREAARFCDSCGAPLEHAEPVVQLTEYKQVTVLFADVVRSMDIAAALGPERLRELMTELVNRSATVVQRYGGSVNQFTGDGFMALFGALASRRCTSNRKRASSRRRSNASTVSLCACGSGSIRARWSQETSVQDRCSTSCPVNRSAWPSGWNRLRHQVA